MDIYEMSEISYKNGYKKGYEDGKKDAVKHGRWEQARYTKAPLYICSKCDKHEYKQHNFCPNCGADMRGEEDG